MLEFVYVWMALAIIFLLASVFGESDMRFGLILVPLFSGIFWLVGWLPDFYIAGGIIPIVLGLAVVTFLKDQFKAKLGAFGSSGSLIWKILAFTVFLQFAIVFVTGLASFNHNNAGIMVNNTVTQTYTLVSAQSITSNYTSISGIDQLTVGLTLPWMMWNVLWSMLLSIFTVVPSLMTVFHLPQEIAVVIGAGFYIAFIIEVFVLLVFRTSPPRI